MTLEEAKALLSQCNRNELRDHAFGDVEVLWFKGVLIATGYFNRDSSTVHIIEQDQTFSGDEASELICLGTLTKLSRNDTTGPDEFVKGQTMHGLTKEGVGEELVFRNVFDI